MSSAEAQGYLLMTIHEEENYRRYFCLSILWLLFVFFFISHNLCWLNTSDRRPTVSFSIPYGWEYSEDAGLELYSAIDYPSGMIREKIRIARPLKNAVISFFIDVAECFYPLSDRLKLGMSYVLHHFMNLIVAFGIIGALFYLSKSYQLCAEGTFLSWLWMLFTLVGVLATSHTLIFQVAISVIAFLAWKRILSFDQFSITKRVIIITIYSLLCGFTVLIKQDYAPYLAILLYAIFTRNILLIIVGMITFNLPLLLYKQILRMVDVPWYNHEAETYGQGIWWINSYEQEGLLYTLKKMFSLLNSSYDAFASYYGVLFIAICVIGFFCYQSKSEQLKKVKLFTILLIISNFIQTIAAGRPLGYMFGDSFIVLSLFFSQGYRRVLEIYSSQRFWVRLSFYCMIGLHIVIVLFDCLRLPWEHPFDHLNR